MCACTLHDAKYTEYCTQIHAPFLSPDFSEHSFERDIIQVLATPTSQEASNHETALVNLTGVLSEEPADQSICETISTGVTRVVVNIAEAYFSRKELSEENKVCIYNTTNSEIDKHSLEHMGSGLVELYHYTLRALAKIQDFIESQVNRTEGASVSAVCVDGFIEAAFCRQCVERTPPLCLLTCNALVRGCYSPYYTVLNGQFEDLWTEVKRLTRSADSAVKNVLSNTLKLVQFPQLVSLFTLLAFTCPCILSSNSYLIFGVSVDLQQREMSVPIRRKEKWELIQQC